MRLYESYIGKQAAFYNWFDYVQVNLAVYTSKTVPLLDIFVYCYDYHIMSKIDEGNTSL